MHQVCREQSSEASGSDQVPCVLAEERLAAHAYKQSHFVRYVALQYNYHLSCIRNISHQKSMVLRISDHTHISDTTRNYQYVNCVRGIAYNN